MRQVWCAVTVAWTQTYCKHSCWICARSTERHICNILMGAAVDCQLDVGECSVECGTGGQKQGGVWSEVASVTARVRWLGKWPSHRRRRCAHHGCGGLVRYTTLRNGTTNRVGTSQRNWSGDLETVLMLMVLRRTRGPCSLRVVYGSKIGTSISVQRATMLVRRKEADETSFLD